MSENKGFWSTLFAPKKKSSCCCGSQIELAPDNTGNNGKKVIAVLGTGCSSCQALYGTVKEAVAQLGIDAIVEKVEDLETIMAYNVMSLPALVVDGKVVSKGKKLSVEQVKALIQ